LEELLAEFKKLLGMALIIDSFNKGWAQELYYKLGVLNLAEELGVSCLRKTRKKRLTHARDTRALVRPESSENIHKYPLERNIPYLP